MTSKKKQARKVHKDFTLAEFDVFVMDQEASGALQERDAILGELNNKRAQIINLATLLPRGDKQGEYLLTLSAGLGVAVQAIRAMPELEDRCECEECGAN